MSDDLSTYRALKDATSSLHYWHDARRQYLGAADKAARSLAHADECIAMHAEKLNAALTSLGFIESPDAQVPHE